MTGNLLIDNMVFVIKYPFLGLDNPLPIMEDGLEYQASLGDRRYLMDNYAQNSPQVKKIYETSPRGYENHIQLKGNVDLQWSPTMPITKVTGNPDKPLVRCPVVEYEKKKIEKFDNLNSIRVDFNPSKDSLEGLRDFLYYLHTNFAPIKKSDFKINKIDIACDYHHKLNPNLFFNRSRKYVIFGDYDHGTRTLYLGDKRSEKQIRIYDKKHEIWEKKKVRVRHDWWRVELVHTPHSGFRFGDKIKNPFSDLRYISQDDIDYSPYPPAHKAWIRAIVRASQFSSIEDTICHIFQDSDYREKKRKRDLMSSLKSQVPFDLPDTVFDKSWSNVYNTFLEKFDKAFDFLIDDTKPDYKANKHRDDFDFYKLQKEQQVSDLIDFEALEAVAL